MSNGYLIGPDLLGKIRRVTDTVEGMPTSTGITRIPTRLQDVPRGGGGGFKICTFTGAWAIDALKTVTFKYQTNTPNTVSVTNLFWPVPDGDERECAIARDGTAWHLIVPRLYSADAATAAEITTEAIEFKTLPVVAFATAGTATFSLSVVSCATATASP
jgi:hypothetical protein